MKILNHFFKIVLGVIMTSIVVFGAVSAAETTDEESPYQLPELFIRAINPGYTINGVSNVGEMIEIGRKKSDEPVLLTGITISYTNSSGNSQVLVEFPEHSWFAGESILLRLASSPDSELAALTYGKTLAFKGGIAIKKGEEILDEICWTGKDGCVKDFKSTKPTILVRNLETGEFEHVESYEPKYDRDSFYEEESENDESSKEKLAQCKGLQFSEILSYYETSKTEQFIELFNSTAEQMLLNGCRVRYKNKEYPLEGIVKAEGYLLYLPVEFSLTKNPTNVGVVEIIDVNDEVVDRLEYPNGQRKATSFAQIGFDANGKEIWKTTYAPTPGEGNIYQEYRTCEAGKVINEETGNCVKITTVEEKTCEPGYYLNPLTGRCKKNELPKIITCKDGYVYNEETGRCRKIKENTGANYELVAQEYEENSSFVALYAVIGIVGVGLIYMIYEFRQEITKIMKRIWAKVIRK